ncbi:MAG: RPA family protein [Halodesulfurarchaeum sp.]
MSAPSTRREVAHRVFAHEFNASDFTYAESDEERAPNYLVTPTGGRVNRLFLVGVLTEVEPVSDDVVRARIVDPTGAFVSYAGQYQPDALAFFERADPPMFVAVTGKARTFQPEGSDRVFTSVRPETVNEVDGRTRDRWVVQTAEHTLERIAVMAAALERAERGEDLRTLLAESGVRPALAAGVPRAIEHYGTTPTYLESLQDLAIDALRVVAGEVDEVERPAADPDEAGEGAFDPVYKDAVTLRATSTGAEETPEPTDVEEASEPAESVPSEPADAEETPERTESAEGPETDVTKTEEMSAGTGDDGVEPETAVSESSNRPEDIEQPDIGSDDAPDDIETDEMYELSEEERNAVEESYDVGFESGAEMRESADETASGGLDETEGVDTEEEAEPETPEESEAPEEIASEPVEEMEAEEEEAVEGTEVPEEEVEEADEAESAVEGPEEPGAGEEESLDVESAEDEEPTSSTADTDATGAEAAAVEAETLEDAVIETMRELGSGDGVERDVLIETVVDARDASEADVADAIESALLGGRCFESGEDHLKPI